MSGETTHPLVTVAIHGYSAQVKCPEPSKLHSVSCNVKAAPQIRATPQDSDVDKRDQVAFVSALPWQLVSFEELRRGREQAESPSGSLK